jgi:MFS family permease
MVSSTAITPSATLSPTPTIVGDANGNYDKPDSTPAPSILVSKPVLSQKTKYGLLAVFSLAFFIDIWSYSAFFIFTGPISVDLDVVFAQQSWVITSYAVTFCKFSPCLSYDNKLTRAAAFLLFWGRVSDLFSAKLVFSYGFIALGILNLIISFLPDKYSFFVLRAVSGIAGAALIPASFRLIVLVFEPEELGKAFTIYGMSGAIANSTGIIVAGLVEFIPNKGQMVAWRWFFRILAAVIVSLTLLPLWTSS